MTCYLNSLIQSLYMTPEFRNAVFRWEYKASSDKKSSTSIPHQLQKLFVLLQTTDRENLETKDLTTSFGWTSAEGGEFYYKFVKIKDRKFSFLFISKNSSKTRSKIKVESE